MDFEWHDAVGGAGALLIVATYLALQLRRVGAEALSYSLANGLGAGLILISLCVDFNLSAALIEGFWLAISIVGVYLWFRRRTVDPSVRAR
jgi:hypothetical protein